MRIETFISAGRCLHGEHWQNALARDLGVNPRTVRGWISPVGKYGDPPDKYIPVLVRLLECRQKAIFSSLSSLLALRSPPP